MGVVGLIEPTAAGESVFCVLGVCLNVLLFFLDAMRLATVS